MALRYYFSELLEDEQGRVYIDRARLLEFHDWEDNIIHVCKGGERLWDIAAKYYHEAMPNPSLWFDVIAYFQPNPIIDPTITFKEGDKVVIPSPERIKQWFQDSLAS